MINWLKQETFSYRLQQLLILVAHLILLKWMFYTLSEAGILQMKQVIIHFIGMSIYGGFLIRGTAYWAQRHFLKAGNKLEK